MNIDIINKQVSNNLKIKETKVKLVNSFYWSCIYRHLYDYNSSPLNIDYICVLYPDKYLLKKVIKLYINKIRFIRTSPKFRSGSVKQTNYIKTYSNALKWFLKLRKENKFTN